MIHENPFDSEAGNVDRKTGVASEATFRKLNQERETRGVPTGRLGEKGEESDMVNLMLF